PATPEAAMDAGREVTEGGPMTLEGLRAAIEEKVAIAEKDVKKIAEANEFIMDRIARYAGQLSKEEGDQLGGIYAKARRRLKELQNKGREATGERPAEPATAEAPASPAIDALSRRIATMRTQRETNLKNSMLSESQREQLTEKIDKDLATMEAELTTLRPPEEPAETGALKAQIAKLEKDRDTNAGMVSGSMQEKVLEDYNRRIAELQEKLGTAAGTGAAAEAVPQATIEAPTTVVQEGSPTGTTETTTEVAPPTPEVAPARPAPSARELMSIAKIRAALHDAPPEALKAAIERAMFTETKAVLENGATREPLIELVKTLGGLEGDQVLRGPAIEKLAAAIGVPAAAIEGALSRQRAALEQRARAEVRKETQAGLKTVIAKGAAYVGLGAVLNRFLPGWGALTAGVRMVETWRQGNLEEKKVQEKLVAFQKQLEEGDLRDPKALAGELLRDLAADVASAKREQVDGLRRPTETETANVGVLAEVMRRDTIRYLQERYPNLTEAQRGELARGAKALYAMDHANATLEAKVAAQQPGGFQKLIATLDKVLGSKALRGGETTKERMLTTAVFAAAGAMARELPVIRNILFAYTGFKAGELLAQGITKRAGRYEITKPVAASALVGETVEKGVLDRARAQLLDSEFRAKSPAEHQQLREAVERHELVLVAKAEHSLDFVAERTASMEATLTQKQKLERERQVVVNGARIAGAMAGAVLGPMAVEWIAKKFHPEQPTAASTEVAPTPEPETDPRMELLSTRQPKDGWVHIRAKQFYGIEHPELSGDQIVAKMEAHKQMLADLRAQHGFKYASNPRHWDDRAFPLKYIELGKADAMVNGALAEDGRTTLVSLRGEGVLPYDETGTGTLDAKGNLQFYETKAKFGFEAGAPVAGREITTGDIRYLDAGDTAMSEDEFAAWLKEHPGSQLTEVRPGGGAGRWATVEIIGAGDEKTTIRVPVGDRAPSASRGDADVSFADSPVETTPGGLVKQGGVEFLTKYTDYERGQILEQIQHDRGVATELAWQIESWRQKYGDRPGFVAFERAVQGRLNDVGDRIKRELDILAGRVSGEVTAEMTRIGDVSIEDVARIELDALDQRLNLRTVAERAAAALSQLPGGTPRI
ncbi:MAG: hypothetical protein Q8R16_03595, partial [bacterium]|nr:hypothetical protein [bacterium]